MQVSQQWQQNGDVTGDAPEEVQEMQEQVCFLTNYYSFQIQYFHNYSVPTFPL